MEEEDGLLGLNGTIQFVFFLFCFFMLPLFTWHVNWVPYFAESQSNRQSLWSFPFEIMRFVNEETDMSVWRWTHSHGDKKTWTHCNNCFITSLKAQQSQCDLRQQGGEPPFSAFQIGTLCNVMYERYVCMSTYLYLTLAQVTTAGANVYCWNALKTP